jgi:hypothetical protein
MSGPAVEVLHKSVVFLGIVAQKDARDDGKAVLLTGID